MDGGPSKINPPNSHSSNPIHKAAIAAQSNDKQTSENPPIVSEKPQIDVSEKHEINKITVIIGVVAVVTLLFMELR